MQQMNAFGQYQANFYDLKLIESKFVQPSSRENFIIEYLMKTDFIWNEKFIKLFDFNELVQVLEIGEKVHFIYKVFFFKKCVFSF